MHIRTAGTHQGVKMFYYAQDSKASELMVGDVINSMRHGSLIETPEPILRRTVEDGWIYFGFAGTVRRIRPEANVKVFGGTK
jgi:hypothetical protein